MDNSGDHPEAIRTEHGQEPPPPAHPGAQSDTVDAPDVLRIESPRLVPLPTYRAEAGDTLYVRVPIAPDREPVNGLYPVGSDGSIDLGSAYGGSVKVAGLTAVEIERKLAERLKKFVTGPDISVYVAQSHALDAVRGDHLVRPDGTVRLGSRGTVAVAGSTLAEVRAAIQTHLKGYLDRPEITVSVSASNSKFFDVLTDRNGTAIRYPFTGVESIRDVLAQVGGATAQSAHQVWVLRNDGDILPLVWDGTTPAGCVTPSSLIRSGDRIVILSRMSSNAALMMARARSAIERAFGLTLLTSPGDGLFGTDTGAGESK